MRAIKVMRAFKQDIAAIFLVFYVNLYFILRADFLGCILFSLNKLQL